MSVDCSYFVIVVVLIAQFAYYNVFKVIKLQMISQILNIFILLEFRPSIGKQFRSIHRK